MHTLLVVDGVFGTHVAEVALVYMDRGDKGKVFGWVTEANLQGTETIAGCRCKSRYR